MVHEYALEPELVALRGDRNNFRYFVTKFGLGGGRLVSRYPKRWKKLVWKVFRGTDDLERKRMEELLIRVSEKMIIRSNHFWDQEKAWVDNAEAEHQRYPFHAILTRENPKEREYVLVGHELGDEQNPLWNVQDGMPVRRIARNMADVVSAMLSNCSAAIFIDPHFGPENSRHCRPLEAFFEALINNRAAELPSRVEVQTSDKAEASFFRTTCEERMPAVIPKGLRVRFVRWKEKPNGEKLHNRYILTDIGAVSFQIGLDEGKDNETDDVTLLKRGQYELRWSQYASDTPAFDWAEEPVLVEGRR